jgi:hypothetical protein
MNDHNFKMKNDRRPNGLPPQRKYTNQQPKRNAADQFIFILMNMDERV